ncbi:MAG: hypothetical protein IT307_14995 [Chloroflexi bacterium]|nr:hypothetical protein [Chloroflexota bacterium]
MSRIPKVLVAAAVMAGNILGFSGLAAQPAEAASNTQAPVLKGAAFNWKAANEDSLVYLTNTQNSLIRALVTARDATGQMLGCAVRTLKPGESGVVYILTSATANDVADNVLNVTVIGLAAQGMITMKATPRAGLFGQIAQVDQSNGALHSVSNLVATVSSADDRQAQIDACLGVGGAAAQAAVANQVVTTVSPSKWDSGKAEAPSKKD